MCKGKADFARGTGPARRAADIERRRSEEYQMSEETVAASLQGISPRLHVGLSLAREAVERVRSHQGFNRVDPHETEW